MRVIRWRVCRSKALAVEMITTSEPTDKQRLCAVLPWDGNAWGQANIDMDPGFEPLLAEAAKGFVRHWLTRQGLPIILHSFDTTGQPIACEWQAWRDGGGPTP